MARRTSAGTRARVEGTIRSGGFTFGAAHPIIVTANGGKRQQGQQRQLHAHDPQPIRVEELVPTIADLGRRHTAYGVTDAHYDSVGAALLWTLEQGLGNAWTADVKAAWAAAYTLLAGVMRDAAKAANDTTIPTQHAVA